MVIPREGLKLHPVSGFVMMVLTDSAYASIQYIPYAVGVYYGPSFTSAPIARVRLAAAADMAEELQCSVVIRGEPLAG